MPAAPAEARARARAQAQAQAQAQAGQPPLGPLAAAPVRQPREQQAAARAARGHALPEQAPRGAAVRVGCRRADHLRRGRRRTRRRGARRERHLRAHRLGRVDARRRGGPARHKGHGRARARARCGGCGWQLARQRGDRIGPQRRRVRQPRGEPHGAPARGVRATDRAPPSPTTTTTATQATCLHQTAPNAALPCGSQSVRALARASASPAFDAKVRALRSASGGGGGAHALSCGDVSSRAAWNASSVPPPVAWSSEALSLCVDRLVTGCSS